MHTIKFTVLVSVLLLSIGCSHRTINLKPQEAGIHEIYFQYLKSGVYYSARGINSVIINEGEERKIRVFIPKGARGRLLITDDGDVHQNLDIKNKSYVDIDFPLMDGRRSKIIGLSLATENFGIMTGRLYIVGNLKVTDPMNVEFLCPYKEDKGLVASCIRPEGFNFFLNIKIDDNYPGKMRVLAAGVCSAEQELYDLKGNDNIILKIESKGSSGYCNITLETRQKYEDNVWKIAKAKIFNVNYYKADYIPLGVPELKGVKGKYEIKMTDYYDGYYLNGKFGGYLSPGKVLKIESDNIFFIVWDKYGRVAWVNSNFENKFSMYNDIKKYVYDKYISKGNMDLAKIKKDPLIVMVMESL